MNWGFELRNLVRELVSHRIYDLVFRNGRIRPDDLGKTGTRTKDTVREADGAAGDLLRETAERMKNKARATRRKGGYK